MWVEIPQQDARDIIIHEEAMTLIDSIIALQTSSAQFFSGTYDEREISI